MLFSSGGRRSSSSAFRTSTLVNSVNRPPRSSPLHNTGGGGSSETSSTSQQQSQLAANRTSSPTDRHRHPHRHNSPSNVYHYRHHHHTQHQQRSPYRKQTYEADEPTHLQQVSSSSLHTTADDTRNSTTNQENALLGNVAQANAAGIIGPVRRLLQRQFVHSNPASSQTDVGGASGGVENKTNIVGGGQLKITHAEAESGGVLLLPSSSSSSLRVAGDRRHSPLLSALSFSTQQQQQHITTNRPSPAAQTIYENRESNVFGWPASSAQQSPAPALAGRTSNATPGIVLERARFDVAPQHQQQFQQQTSLEMVVGAPPGAAGLAPHLLHAGDEQQHASGGGGGIFHIKKSDSHQSQAAIAHMQHSHHFTVHALANVRSTKWLPTQIGGMRIFYGALNAIAFGCSVAGAIITLRLACDAVTRRFGEEAEHMPIWLAWFFGCWLLPIAPVALLVIRTCTAAENHNPTRWCYVSGCGSASREEDDEEDFDDNSLNEEKDELNMGRSNSFSLLDPLRYTTSAILMPRRRISGIQVSVFRTLMLLFACALCLMGSLYLFIMGVYRLQLTCVIICMFTLIASLNFCSFWVWFHDAFVGTKLLATTIAAAGYTLIAYSDGFIYTGMPMRARGILFVTSSAIIGAVGILILRMACVERKLRNLRMIELSLLQTILGLMNATVLWCIPLVLYLAGLEPAPIEQVTELPFQLIVGSAALMLLALMCVVLETSALQVSSIHFGFTVAIFVCYILDSSLSTTSMTSYEWAGALCMTLAMLIGMLPGELAYFCIALLPGLRLREKLLHRDAVHKRINDFRLGPRELLRLYAAQEAKLANLNVQRERRREQLRLANERNSSNRTLLQQAMSSSAQVTAALATAAPTSTGAIAPPVKSPLVQHMIRLTSAHPFQGFISEPSFAGVSGSISNTALLSAAAGNDGV